MRTPVRFAVVAMVANMILNLTLVWPLAHAGLALATSLAACLNAGLLLRGLLRGGAYRPLPGWRSLLARTALAVAVMAGALLWASPGLPQWLDWGTWERAGRLAALIGLGIAAYFVTLLAGGMRPRDFGSPGRAPRPPR
jgi:putative peptidoglycan lipid II flippase